MNSFRSSKGYALATVFIFSALLCLTAAALLQYSGTEFRLNQRNQLRFQAKNAAEAMLEYGTSELAARLQLKRNFTTAELRAAPLNVQNTRKTTLFAQGAGTYNNVASTALSLWASQYTDATTRTIDAKDPGNLLDPLSGQTVRTTTIRLLASAISTAPGLSETQYATQSIEIRDVYLFNYAIFYNVKMEFHPGANMIISGPVHSNEDTYLTTNYSLKFLDKVTVAGKFYGTALSSGRPSGQNVYFSTAHDIATDGVNPSIAINDGSIQNAAGATLGTYVDSNLGTRSPGNSFKDVAQATWFGNIVDGTNVDKLTPPGITSGSSTNAHKLIEPPDTSGSADANIEGQKFSNLAGLYIFQGANSGGTPPAPVAFTNAADVATYKAFPTQLARDAWLGLLANKSKVVALPSGVINTKRHMTDQRESSVVSTVDIDVGALRTAINSTTSGATTNIKAWNSSAGTYTDDWNPDAAVTRNGSADTAWNGQLYVEVENPNAGYTETSDVNGSGTGTRTAVRLVNGAQVPNRKTATGSASSADGFTVATNAPAYIVGNLNSPGMNAGTRAGVAVGTETAATIGTEKDGESPVAIAADAINILSNAWWSSGKPSGDSTSADSSRPAASANTEIAAAFLTGNVASVSGGSYSGGVENFPRFHENWGGSRTIRYRGSMVALFNSTIATGPVSNAGYTPPDRQWGFSNMFASGRQPPGTPFIRTYRRITYGDLTPAQFNSLRTSTSPNFDFVAQ